ncbi:hypothetical protein XAPC_1437 [Xanthomonas citri pv. punicae str. LMG 859]|nr:hypothetical protein XAPC_1437 [Xanthomonas citri pv. punicae str. LMG 859]
MAAPCGTGERRIRLCRAAIQRQHRTRLPIRRRQQDRAPGTQFGSGALTANRRRIAEGLCAGGGEGAAHARLQMGIATAASRRTPPRSLRDRLCPLSRAWRQAVATTG